MTFPAFNGEMQCHAISADQVKRIERAGGKELFWAESLILTFFMAFGGGILAPFLLGKPPVFFVNDLMVPLVRP